MKKNIFKQFRFVDLFAGVGGFRIALEELGHKCVFSSELNNECRKVYKRNFKDTPFGDINNIKSNISVKSNVEKTLNQSYRFK